MIDESQKLLIIKFLKLNYPVGRLKIGAHFKRGYSDLGIKFLSANKSDMTAFRLHLINTIIYLFNCDNTIATEVTDMFLSTKLNYF